jgi:hypothetical protein
VPACETVPQEAAFTGVPDGAAMSTPACWWPGLDSPKEPVFVPFTGVTVEQPLPADTGVAAGSGVAASVLRSCCPSSADSCAEASPRAACGAAFTPAICFLTDAGTDDSFMNVTFDLKSSDHVFASTTPVAGRPIADWKRLTAPSVIGPKIPSSSTPTRRWSSATAPPVDPKRISSAPGFSTPPPSLFAGAAGADPASSGAAALAATTGPAGAAATAPVNASDVALRRRFVFHPAAARRRRCRALRVDRAQTRASVRSRSPGGR